MRKERQTARLARLLREWRRKRRASQRVLAQFAGLGHSVVARAERGIDARLSTWEKLFEALGCRLEISVRDGDYAEDCEDYLLHETDRRLWRRLDALE